MSGRQAERLRANATTESNSLLNISIVVDIPDGREMDLSQQNNVQLQFVIAIYGLLGLC
jgi:hypothetical protein